MPVQVSKRTITQCAQHAYQWTYDHLFRMHVGDGLSDELAKSVAKDAADALGNALLRDLPTNGVEITEEKR